MSRLNVLLFGKLSIRCDEQPVSRLTGPKGQELFCCLLLHRDRPRSRALRQAVRARPLVASLLLNTDRDAQTDSRKTPREIPVLSTIAAGCHPQ